MSLAANHSNAVAKLKNLLPADRVLTAEDKIKPYSCDMTEADPAMPDAVAYPLTTEEVVAVVKMANEEKCPIVPCVARTNLGALTLPTSGGIILDFTKMNRILKVNRDEMYIVIEPGVTFQQIKDFLEANHGDLRFSYPLSPPWTSVTANALLQDWPTSASAEAPWTSG